MEPETDVVVIGSGFGGSVAALRFTEAGQRVTVLERGDRVSRDKFQADLDALWLPHRNAYGIYDLREQEGNVVPVTSAAVGGGSHVFAGVLMRRDAFAEFPAPIRDDEDMEQHYGLAERTLAMAPYPEHAPYGTVPQHRVMVDAGDGIAASAPELVEDHGVTNVAISFAPSDPAQGRPGEPFTNPHGCAQRYHDPRETGMLGGDIETKNSLDRNYLFLAEKRGAVVEPLCEVERLDREPDGRWRVTFRRHLPVRDGGWAAFVRRWITRPRVAVMSEPESIVAKRVVVSAGAIGSTQLLLRNRHVATSPALGTRYTTNGDYLMLMLPLLRFVPAWLAVLAGVVFAFLGAWLAVAAAAVAYYACLLVTPAIETDRGAPISTYVRFRGPDGSPGYTWVESGTYPQLERLFAAIVISALTGRFRPRLYRTVRAVTRVLAFAIPPLGAIVRSYPLPLLAMGRDDAVGTLRLGAGDRLVVDYPIADNRAYYTYLEGLGRRLARSARVWWLRRATFVFGRIREIPHNQGGVPMAEDPRDGVVDHAGRVFGQPNLMVLDGSIVPRSIGPNPSLTIAALAERAMIVILEQIGEHDAPVVADEPPPAAAVVVA